MRCICYIIVLCIVIRSSTLGAARASVQESVSNPKVAFSLSYLAAWNLRSGLDLRGRQAGRHPYENKRRQPFCTFSHTSQLPTSISDCGPETGDRKSPDC